MRWICTTQDNEEVELKGTKKALLSFSKEFLGMKISRCREYHPSRGKDYTNY